jgi:N-methylhydantoinase B
LKKGDTYSTYPSGGGGWGDPLDRDPELVRIDVQNEIISFKSAEKIYGVIVSRDDYQIDSDATSRLREELRSS